MSGGKGEEAAAAHGQLAASTLPDILRDCFERLARGKADRRSPFHTPTMATIGLDGRPRQRVVVLRGVDPAARTLRFHTDRRSDKAAELARDPRVALTGYDPGAKIQIRVEGTAALHTDDAVADAAWEGSRMASRACYATAPAPGTPLGAPEAFSLPETDADILAGRAHFCAVVVAVARIEWLYLKFDGHRRARFEWPRAGGEPVMDWLVP